jgi:putative flippase GtrA
VVGSVGFIVDAAVLTALVRYTDLGVYLPRLVSFPSALTVTWYLNRIWTFPGATTHGRVAQYSRYAIVQTLGALLNLGVYSLAIAIGPAWFASVVAMPLAIASSIALVFNYAGSKVWAFRQRSSESGAKR